MIICHCNRISDGQILEVAERLKQEHPDRPIRSNLIYRGCGCRPQCGCCRPSIEALLLNRGYEVTVTKSEEIARIRVPRYLDKPNIEAGE